MSEIINTLIIPLLLLAGQLWLNQQFKRADEKRDKARQESDAKCEAEAKWRSDIEQRMEGFEKILEQQNDKIDSVLKNQLTQTRSDIVHKAHRYLDDLGCASTEEKNVFDAQYKEYIELCEAYNIENNFVTEMHEQVMNLPGRTYDSEGN